MLSDAEATIYAATRNMLNADGAGRSETRQGTLAWVARDALVNYLIALDVYDNDVEAHRVVHGGLILHRAEPQPEPEPDEPCEDCGVHGPVHYTTCPQYARS